MFTKNDETKIEQIGYTIIPSVPRASFVMFMRIVFPDFDLVSLLQKVETCFTPTTEAKIHRIIQFDLQTLTLKLMYYNDYDIDANALVFIRTFVGPRESIEVKHDYCILPTAHQGKGLAKPVFQESLAQYLKMGAKKISVHAGLGIGGYAWAKYGFMAIDKEEVEIILEEAESGLATEEYKMIKKIYDHHYSQYPDANGFPIELWAEFNFMKPILMGSDWHGELDLTDEAQITKFVHYVYRQK